MIPRVTRTSFAVFSFSLVVVLVLILGMSGDTAAQTSPQEVVPIWGTDVRANADNTNYSQHEPHLAISRTNTDIVVAVAKDYRINNNKEVWIYVSQDGGQTWPVDLQRQIPGMPTDIPNQSDPVAMARDDGRIYVVALGHGGGHGLFITWTDDNGNTWQDPSIQITYNETPPGSLDDKEWLAIDNNPASPYYHNMYVAWANGGILFKRSTNGGMTWSSYINLTPGQYTEYPYPIVGADGTLYVFYMDNWGYCADGWIRYMKSTNGGVNFSEPYTVVSTSQPCSPIHGGGGYDQWRFFSIITAAADPNDPDNLWVAWTDDNDIDYGKTDVLYVHSTDGGVSWSAAERLSHDDPNAYVDHITPVFAISADSRLHAFWLDRRDDPSNILFHGYHTSTADGGITWEPDTRVSDQSFDLNLYLPPPPTYKAAGDYWGLDVVDNIVMAAWNTTVETSQDIYIDRGYLSGLGVLTGQVSDSETSAPIQDALVSVDIGLSDTTNASGFYTITLPMGVYTATAQAAGYFTQTISGVDIMTGTNVLDFALEPLTATVSGEVSDALTSLPIQGALLSASDGSSAFTNESGIYTLTLNSGIYTFTAQAEGYASQSLTGIEIISGSYIYDFALEPLTATLTGQVSEAITSLPIQGAQVSVHNGPSTLTDDDGYYTFTLTTGTYTVRAGAEGYLSQSQVIDVISGTATLDFSLEPFICALPEILSVNVAINGLSVSFSPSFSSTSPLSYLWGFGDGTTSTLEAPMHTYPNYDRFTATLNVTNDCGMDNWSGEVLLVHSAYLPIIFNPTP